MSRMTSYWTLILVGLLICSQIHTTAPAGAAPQRPAKGKQSGPGRQRPARSKPVTIEDHPLIKRLTAIRNGPGLVVCEPAPKDVPQKVADFGDGCGRWLHVIVAGQPEFSKTPLWSFVDEARRALKRADLRLSPSEAAQLRSLLGITHSATGELKRSGQTGFTLTYQVWAHPGKKPVGAPVSVTGSEQEICAGLPKLAAELQRRLGMAAPRVPEKTAESVEELRFVGGIPWVPDERLSTQQLGQLERMAMGRFGAARSDGKANVSVVSTLLVSEHQAKLQNAGWLGKNGSRVLLAQPENTILLAEVYGSALLTSAPVSEEWEARRTALSARYPNNYLLRACDVFACRSRGQWKNARASMEMAVRCARQSPQAWMGLHNTIFDEARTIRRGRTIDAMSPAELKRCEALYAEAIPLAVMAANVAPELSVVWETLSSAAAFLGDMELADEAFWLAVERDPADADLLAWGLHLYHPKWIGDQKRLERVADLCLRAAPSLASFERLRAAVKMVRGGLGDRAMKMVQTDAERAELRRLIAGR